jgi:hypothetical protein
MITFTATNDALLELFQKTRMHYVNSDIEYVEVEVYQFETGCSQGSCAQLGVYKGPSLKFWAYFPVGGGCTSRTIQKQLVQLIPIEGQLFEIRTWDGSGKRDVNLHGDFQWKPKPTKQERVLALLAEIKKVVEAA